MGCVGDGACWAAVTVESSRGRGGLGVLKIGPESSVHRAMMETQRNSMNHSPFLPGRRREHYLHRLDKMQTTGQFQDALPQLL